MAHKALDEIDADIKAATARLGKVYQQQFIDLVYTGEVKLVEEALVVMTDEQLNELNKAISTGAKLLARELTRRADIVVRGLFAGEMEDAA